MKLVLALGLLILTQTTMAAQLICNGNDALQGESGPPILKDIPMQTDTKFTNYIINVTQVSDVEAAFVVTDLTNGKTTQMSVPVQPQNVNAGAQNLVLSITDKPDSPDTTNFPSMLFVHCYTK